MKIKRRFNYALYIIRPCLCFRHLICFPSPTCLLQDMVVLYDSLQLAHKCILNSFYGYVMRKYVKFNYNMVFICLLVEYQLCNNDVSVVIQGSKMVLYGNGWGSYIYWCEDYPKCSVTCRKNWKATGTGYRWHLVCFAWFFSRELYF